MKEVFQFKEEPDLEDKAFFLWTILTDGAELRRTLEEDSEIQRICKKICNVLTEKELDTLLSIKPEIKKEAKEFCSLLSE